MSTKQNAKAQEDINVESAFAWSLACLPIAEPFISRVVADLHTEQAVGMRFAIFLAMTISLALIDARRLEYSGRYNKDAGLKRWCWLAPVYLFRRSGLLKDRYKFFGAWLFAATVSVFIGAALFKSTAYFGLGRPSCHSLSTTNIVKVVFPKIESIAAQNISATGLLRIIEIENLPSIRSCDALMQGTDGKTYPIRYKIFEEGQSRAVRVFLL